MKASRLAIVCLCMAACGSDVTEPPPPSLASVTLGGAADAMRGTGGFRALAAEAELPLRPGSQGGLHVYINMRLSTAAVDRLSDNPVVYREARRVRDGTLVSRLEHRARFVGTSTGGFETERSVSLFLCPTPVGVDVADELLELTVELMPQPDAAPQANGTLRFVPVCTEDNEELCQRLCTW